jgi:hypothetical protein
VINSKVLCTAEELAMRSFPYCAVLLFWGTAAGAQLLPGTSTLDGTVDPETIPMAIAMYDVFAVVTSMEEEQPGYGKRVVQHTIGIEDDASAHALTEYIKTAFYAGRASSMERKREFCRREIVSREDLIQASEDRELAHNAELHRLAEGAADVVAAEDYAKLVEYAASRRSQRTLIRFDPQVMYGAAAGPVDVSAEVVRRCGA